MPAVAVRVDGLKIDGNEGRWAFRVGLAVGKAFRVCYPHLVKGSLALCHNDGDAVEEHVGELVGEMTFFHNDVPSYPLIAESPWLRAELALWLTAGLFA